jgi:hypothetical protein
MASLHYSHKVQNINRFISLLSHCFQPVDWGDKGTQTVSMRHNLGQFTQLTLFQKNLHPLPQNASVKNACEIEDIEVELSA